MIELVVEGVDPALHHLSLGIGQVARRAEEVGALAALDRRQVQAEFVEQRRGIEMADEDADRSRDRRRLGPDLVRARRHVVAARGGHVAQARYHRLLLLLPRPHQLSPDQVGCRSVAARGIDANHDGRDPRVVGRPADAPDDGV